MVDNNQIDYFNFKIVRVGAYSAGKWISSNEKVYKVSHEYVGSGSSGICKTCQRSEIQSVLKFSLIFGYLPALFIIILGLLIGFDIIERKGLLFNLWILMCFCGIFIYVICSELFAVLDKETYFLKRAMNLKLPDLAEEYGCKPEHIYVYPSTPPSGSFYLKPLDA